MESDVTDLGLNGSGFPAGGVEQIGWSDWRWRYPLLPLPTDDPSETDGLDAAIVPTDFNVILDDDLRVIVCKLPVGAHFTMLADCCHSGTMLDHKVCRLPNGDGKLSPAEQPVPRSGKNK